QQDERSAGAVHVALVRVAVTPERQLLEHEEDEDAAEERREHAPRAQRRERLGQQLDKRDAQQRADRVADEPGHQPIASRGREDEQRRGDEQAAEAAEEAETERDRQQRHATLYPSSGARV